MSEKINKIFDLVHNYTISEDAKELASVWSLTISSLVLMYTTVVIFH